jgi:hypothetical protein
MEVSSSVKVTEVTNTGQLFVTPSLRHAAFLATVFANRGNSASAFPL